MTLPYLDELKKRNSNNKEFWLDNSRKVCECKKWDFLVTVFWYHSMGWGSWQGMGEYSWARGTIRRHQMIDMCKVNGIKGYSKLRKSELANRLMNI